jgi:hypothetical protein
MEKKCREMVSTRLRVRRVNIFFIPTAFPRGLNGVEKAECPYCRLPFRREMLAVQKGRKFLNIHANSQHVANQTVYLV